MRMLKQLNRNLPPGNSRLARVFIVLAISTVLALAGCNINVKKEGEGEEKKVDIDTPLGALHVAKDADVRDIGLPVYPGARRKEQTSDGDENNAHINISTSLFGIKVVAIEFLSDDTPEKLVAYYNDQLKKYGSVLECHTSHLHIGSNMNGVDTSGDTKKLKCGDDQNGKTVELKVGTDQNQHIVSIKPADDGKGSDFGLVYIQMRGGKDTI
jgi:hypothetical protein